MQSVPSWFYVIVVTIVYFGYIFLGGLVFMLLEKPREERICAEIKANMEKVSRLNKEAERYFYLNREFSSVCFSF